MFRALKDKKRFIRNLILIFIIFLFIFLLYQFEAFRDIIFIVLVSGIFAYILKPLYSFLCERT
ncbi:AI-2E family transporter, partial [Clostridium perfringens]|nr:AI-2E family transporter [Clostridium perfringens]